MTSDRWARCVSEPRRKGGGGACLRGLGRGWADPRRKGRAHEPAGKGKGGGRPGQELGQHARMEGREGEGK